MAPYESVGEFSYFDFFKSKYQFEPATKKDRICGLLKNKWAMRDSNSHGGTR